MNLNTMSLLTLATEANDIYYQVNVTLSFKWCPTSWIYDGLHRYIVKVNSSQKL